MKYILKSLTLLFIFMLFINGKTHQKNSSMHIVRGLKPTISEYTVLEQDFIMKIANKLKSNGFPLNQLTRVHLKNRIHTKKDYYTYNEVTFLINPGVYKQGEFNSGIENIGIGWEDPSMIRTPDGGIEFEVGRKVKYTDLVMDLFRLKDSYSSYTLLKDHDNILEKINEVLISNEIEDIKYFTSKGILELIKNYHISITAHQEKEEVYEMEIRKLDHGLINPKHFNALIKQYRLLINLNTLTIEVLNSFDPTFFPTPAIDPSSPFTKE
ncbi:hypothetical protein [Flavivirga eckloniae]|uniref:Uncharacterized protein n=1 Tax=Flavivirga eckloniae TaxID=1803846 RepID=A0A2K9PM38_9FLAO|nr:hypothetical protein [Flavivirga eckloniae]AUP78096.1 hypothetical protein C1H87_04945 [Flavivirga eckloniae]